MKLIGAGLPRTGTMSTRAALNTLGLRAYHMEEAVMKYERGDLDKWNALFEGTGTVDWQQFIGEYDATTDAPACFFYKELMEAFPDALVLLNVRDPENWCNSLEALIQMGDKIGKYLNFIPRFRKYRRDSLNWKKILYGGDNSDRANLIASFTRHNEEVKATVPPERLLVYRVSDGWEPLCKFLGVPVPNEPFPHLNKGEDLDKSASKAILPLLLKDLTKMSLPYAAGTALVIVVLILIFGK
jgi:hypothetical protein